MSRAVLIDDASKKRVLRQQRYAHLTEDQYELMLAFCDEHGLNPWRDHIWLTSRAGENRNEMLVQIKLQALRDLAATTGEYAGQLGPFWAGPDRKWVRLWTHDTPPEGARVGVLRKGEHRAVWGIARWREAAQYIDPERKTLDPFWAEKPSLMLAKVAEALALRRAFPTKLGGLYTTDEISLKQSAPRLSPVCQPVSDDTPTSEFLFQKRLISEFELANPIERQSAIDRMRKKFPELHSTDRRAFWAASLAELRDESRRPDVG